MAKTCAGIGAFRHRVNLQAPVLTPDGAGGETTSWSTVATLWASLRWLAGEERWRGDRFEQASRYEVTLRWRSDVTAGMRFEGAGSIFGIISAGDPTGRRLWLVCQAEEISP